MTNGKFSGYLLVSDMDATLLTNKHAVSEGNRQAIEYFVKNGGQFTVATGRMVEAVRSYMTQMTVNAPAVLHNGAKIYDFETDKTIFEKFIEEERKDAIRRVYNDFPEIGLEIYCNETVYVYRECRETQRFLTRNYNVVYSLPDEVWQRDWIKVLLIGDKKLLDRYEPIYRAEYDSGYCVRSGKRFLDVVANGVSKGRGVQMLRDMLGIEHEKVIAVGDNMNDISMLCEAGISYAVQNGAEEAKRAAHFIAPDNNSDAIAYVIEHIKR